MATTSPPRAKRVRHCLPDIPTSTHVERFPLRLSNGITLAIDRIRAGNYIFRGRHDYAREEGGLWLIQRHPKEDLEEKKKPVYFAKEANEAGGYGCIAAFQAKDDIFTLAIDDNPTRAWLHQEAKKNASDVHDALQISFSMDRPRESVYDNDMKVANYICNRLSLQFVLDGRNRQLNGYSSQRYGQFTNIHAEFALCAACLHELDFACLDIKTCSNLQVKMLAKKMEEERKKKTRRVSDGAAAGASRNLFGGDDSESDDDMGPPSLHRMGGTAKKLLL